MFSDHHLTLFFSSLETDQIFMQRSDGGGAFQALDTLNGELLCGSTDIHSCVG